ncbi:Septal ring factor [Serratia rubidaea]|uniref:Septal ring factor n=1 Tax=Serratia rubidaea TaxID=61652 RepID=A0A3S4FSA2_SERRU|nr:Septal ring factor [Serratia rubidaea]
MREKAYFALSRVTRGAKAGSQLLPQRVAPRKLTTLCASVLYAGVLLLPLSGHAADDNKSQLKDIQQSIAEKEKAVKQQQQQRSSLQDKLRQQEKTIAQASRSLRSTQSTLTTLGKDISGLNASIAKLQKQQTQQQNILSRQLDAAFRQGQHSAVQLILSGEESQRSERILAYFGYLNEARQKKYRRAEANPRGTGAAKNHAGRQAEAAKIPAERTASPTAEAGAGAQRA